MGGETLIEGCTFNGNSAGGATSIRGDFSKGSGGAIAAKRFKVLNITLCIFDGNSAEEGAAIYVSEDASVAMSATQVQVVVGITDGIPSERV